MPFQTWCTANTNHFPLTDSVSLRSRKQLGWVTNPVQHNLLRRIRFWMIKSPEQDFKYCTERQVKWISEIYLPAAVGNIDCVGRILKYQNIIAVIITDLGPDEHCIVHLSGQEVKWRLLLLLFKKKQCNSFVWNSQGAVFYSHRSEWLWFADCRHIFYFSKKKRHVERNK